MIGLDLIVTLHDAYNSLNEYFFESELPGAMILLHRKRGSYGYFANGRFVPKVEGEEPDIMSAKAVDEIALNPEEFTRPSIEVLSTLLHEMVHQNQEINGTPSRNNYHNREFAQMMLNVGLICSQTGEEGGKQTGNGMTHYWEKDSVFAAWAANFLKSHNLNLTAFPLPVASNKRNKVGYVCWTCQNTVYGKPGLDIGCNICGSNYEPKG